MFVLVSMIILLRGLTYFIDCASILDNTANWTFLFPQFFT